MPLWASPTPFHIYSRDVSCNYIIFSYHGIKYYFNSINKPNNSHSWCWYNYTGTIFTRESSSEYLYCLWAKQIRLQKSKAQLHYHLLKLKTPQPQSVACGILPEENFKGRAARAKSNCCEALRQYVCNCYNKNLPSHVQQIKAYWTSSSIHHEACWRKTNIDEEIPSCQYFHMNILHIFTWIYTHTHTLTHNIFMAFD